MLLEATKQGRIFMVNYLLESKKVDINETDKNGQTPLISACLLDDNMANTRRKLIRLFLTRNVDVNQADVSGRNALMWACQLGKIDVVKILFGRSLMELNFTCTDHAGNTALHYASSSGQYTLTTMLVEAMKRFGVSLDIRNEDGMTPLLAATKKGKEMCARVLLENGASPGIVDTETLMNVKELAEKGQLGLLVEQITIRNPRTQSRCTFPKQPDDDALRSAAESSRESSPPITSRASTSHSNEARSPLLNKRKEKHCIQNASSNHLNNLLNVGTPDRFLTTNANVPRIPSPRPATEGSAVPCLYPQMRSGPNDNPFDLHDLRSVLSIYGEQQAPTFRRGFRTPVMSTEAFQNHLVAMKLNPQSMQNHRSSVTRSSTSSAGLSSLLQQRRRSILLKEYNLRGPSSNNRRHTICHSTEPPSWRRESPLARNKSYPLIDMKLSSKLNSQRRHSIVVPALHQK